MISRIEQLLEFLKESPNDNFLRYALAQEYVKTGQKETGYEYYLGLIKDAPDYVATYYHLGKLYESDDNNSKALVTYSKGIEIAQKIGDQHSLSELQSAKLELEMEDLL
jgi:tetratricopeptide (TPR) repeat protein